MVDAAGLNPVALHRGVWVRIPPSVPHPTYASLYTPKGNYIPNWLKHLQAGFMVIMLIGQTDWTGFE